MGTMNIYNTSCANKASITYTGTSDITVDMGKLFPSGGIILWSGSIASIPAGWALCDGNNGTPNLKDRFVVGAGNSYAVGATGGSTSASGSGTTGDTTLSSTQMPSHNHSASTKSDCYTNYGNGYFYAITNSGLCNYNYIANMNTNSNGGGGSHNHSFSWSATIIPPYYALAYIMKL